MRLCPSSLIFPCVLHPKETRNTSASKLIALKAPPVFQRETLQFTTAHVNCCCLCPTAMTTQYEIKGCGSANLSSFIAVKDLSDGSMSRKGCLVSKSNENSSKIQLQSTSAGFKLSRKIIPVVTDHSQFLAVSG